MTAARVLLVEDDPEISELISDALGMEGYSVDATAEGAGLVERLAAAEYGLVILDRMLPDAEGAALCRRLREAGNGVLILMLTARDALEDKIEGLQAGADDYMTKPFAIAELTMRVETLLRRAGRGAPIEDVLHVGPLSLDRRRKAAEVDGTAVQLTATEFALLRFLMENPGRPVSRTELLKGVWGYDFDPHTNVVEVYISYLRRKLGDATRTVTVETVRGFGYRMKVADVMAGKNSA